MNIAIASRLHASVIWKNATLYPKLRFRKSVGFSSTSVLSQLWEHATKLYPA